ncbi:hypothetical protein BOX15_Mlig009721g1 [Macrostomum lignano]|uniref:Uncharacterized protein n=1 Tax=Macrostomum lignano TaxID=282301 RepID=A0A267EPV2_9PLAT|nr:hypothetical protein BOX15_Mlig009721g1 [Macrostomum lignano]
MDSSSVKNGASASSKSGDPATSLVSNSLWPNCPNGCHDACSLAALSVHKAQIAGVSLPGRFRITMRRVHGSLHQQLLLNRSVRWLCQRLLLSESSEDSTSSHQESNDCGSTSSGC